MKRKLKSLFSTAFKILASAAIIGWLISSGKLDFNKLISIFSPSAFLIAMLLIFGNLFLSSERWRLLVRSQGGQLRLTSAFRLTLIGIFFNFAMPGGVGGDIVKGYYFDRELPGQRALAITSVLFDRVLGLFAMMFMALLVMSFDIEHVQSTSSLLKLYIIFALLFFSFAIALLLIFSKKIHRSRLLHKIIAVLPLSTKLEKFYETLHQYGRSPSISFYTIAISLVAQSFSVLFLYYVGQISGFEDVPLKTYFMVAPIGFMATAIPISPAGVGIGQAAFLFLFDLYLGRSTGLGPLVITAFQGVLLIYGLFGALLYMLYRKRS